MIRPDDRLRGLVPDSFETYQIVEPGDIVVRPTDLQNDWNSLRFALSPHRGIITSAYICLRTQGEMTCEYGYFLLHAYDLKKIFYGLGSGLRQNLDWEDFKSLPCLVPSVAEQDAIVRFLDHADMRIRRAIRAKQKLIALLNEQKQAVIHRAVTRGVDPNVRLKPSGVDWLGDVPEHWETAMIKSQLLNLNSRRIPLSSTERGAMSERRYDYYGASGVIDKVDDYLFDDELLLVAEDGANLVLRNLPLAIVARGKFWVNNHAHILKPRRGHIEYFAALLESIDFRPWITGAAQPKLTQDRLMAIPIPVPPPSEQAEIARWISTESDRDSPALERVRREISLLHEYRTRLIADVVTGKLDVREAAADLPDEPEELGPLDEIEVEQMEEPEVGDLEPVEA